MSWTDWGDDAKENCECEGESCPLAFSGDRRVVPACWGNALLPEYVEVDDGRDIFAWVEVELLTEWGMTRKSKRWGIEDIRVTTRVICLGRRAENPQDELLWDLPRYG